MRPIFANLVSIDYNVNVFRFSNRKEGIEKWDDFGIIVEKMICSRE